MKMDYFGKNTDGLSKKRLFLFDMDGTIYKDNELFDGTIQLLEKIELMGGKYVFITNNSSKSVNEYVDKLKKMGISAERENFFTATHATIEYLNKYHVKEKVYCQGTKALIQELKMGGIDVTENVEKVEVVLVGFDTELTSYKLKKTCEILQKQNVTFLGTNPDLRCPVKFGFIPDCGTICQMISNVTRKAPTFIGKPNPVMVDSVLNMFDYSKEETVVIGDRLYTDIATGINAGVDTVCVLTGEATIEEIEQSREKPAYTYLSVKEFMKSL